MGDNPLIAGIPAKIFDRIIVIIDGLNRADIEPDTGPRQILGVMYNGKLFRRDDADSTTADDGLTCIILGTTGPKRFKADSLQGQVLNAYYVLDFRNDQPASGVALGDQYGVGVSPTGSEWASKANHIATAIAGDPAPIWIFTAPVEGMTAYDADRTTWRQVKSDLTWTDGLQGSYGIDTIPPEAITAKRFNVEAILTSEPISPADGQYFIVGTPATGEFLGHDNEIAKRAGSSWEFITPSEGDQAFNRSTDRQLNFVAGTFIGGDADSIQTVFPRIVVDGNVSLSGNAPSQTIPPVSTDGGHEIFSAVYQAKRIDNRFDIEFSIRFTSPAGVANPQVAIFIDGATNAEDWIVFSVPASGLGGLTGVLTYLPGDTDPHDIIMRIGSNNGGTFHHAEIRIKEFRPS